MALVSGKRTIAGMPDSGIANVFAAVGNQPMAKVLLIEDDGETVKKLQPNSPIAVLKSNVGQRHRRPRQSALIEARRMIVDRLCPEWTASRFIEALRKEQVPPRCWC